MNYDEEKLASLKLTLLPSGSGVVSDLIDTCEKLWKVYRLADVSPADCKYCNGQWDGNTHYHALGCKWWNAITALRE
jgi:hypothetical protein